MGMARVQLQADDPDRGLAVGGEVIEPGPHDQSEAAIRALGLDALPGHGQSGPARLAEPGIGHFIHITEVVADLGKRDAGALRYGGEPHAVPPDLVRERKRRRHDPGLEIALALCRHRHASPSPEPFHPSIARNAGRARLGEKKTGHRREWQWPEAKGGITTSGRTVMTDSRAIQHLVPAHHRPDTNRQSLRFR
jgi:hypothetical protein